jgi:hypothetical protein
VKEKTMSTIQHSILKQVIDGLPDEFLLTLDQYTAIAGMTTAQAYIDHWQGVGPQGIWKGPEMFYRAGDVRDHYASGKGAL